MVNMVKRRRNDPGNLRKRNLIILVFFWISGTCIGLYFGFRHDQLLADLMLQAVSSHALWTGCFLKVLFPLLLCIGAAIFSFPAAIYASCLVKGICFSCCTYAVYITFNCAAWIVYLLLLFSDLCVIVMLFLLLFKILLQQRLTQKIIPAYIAVALLCCAVDYFVLSPFLTRLMYYS